MNLKLFLTAASGAIISCFAVHEHLEKVRLESELCIVKMDLEMVSGLAYEQEQQISTLSNQLDNISVLDVVSATYDRLYNKAIESSFFVYFTSSTAVSTTDDNDNEDSITSASSASTTQSVEDLVPPDPPSSTRLLPSSSSTSSLTGAALPPPPPSDKSSSSETMIIKTTTEIFTSMYRMFTCESHFGLLVCKNTSMYRMFTCESHLGLLVCTSIVLVVVFVYYNKDPVSQVIQRFVTNLPTTSSSNMQAMMHNIFKFGCSVLSLLHQVIDFAIYAFRDCRHKMYTLVGDESFCMTLYERAKSTLHVAPTAMKQECGVISSLPFTMKNGFLFLMMLLASIKLYWTQRENRLAVAALAGMFIVYKSGMFLITQHLRFIKIFIWFMVIAMAKHEMWNENNTVLYRLWILFIAIAIPIHCAYLLIVDCFGRWAHLIRYMFFGNQIGQFIVFVIHCVTFVVFPPAVIVLAVFTWMVYKKLCRVEVQGLKARDKHGHIFDFGFVASHVTTMMNT